MKRLPLLAAALALVVLPGAARADEAEVHTMHCLHACPNGAPAGNDLVVREIYTLSSNDARKLADWVAYRVTAETIGSGGERDWAPDPWLAPDETLEPPDYDGANRALRTDRGHQAPLASLAGTGRGDDTNLLSNITPQSSALNQGPWVRLENAERDLIRAGGLDTLYVLTGPLYEREMAPLPGADEGHVVPSGYWKVLVTADGRLSAFVMNQDMARNAPHCGARVPLEEVERRSGLSFFSRLFERQFLSLDAGLGCR